MNERAYWVALVGTPGIGPVTFRSLMGMFESAEAVWKVPAHELLRKGVKEHVRTMLLRRRKQVDPGLFMNSLARGGVEVVCEFEESYPKLLKGIKNAPPVLFVRGSVRDLNIKSIAVVGTRKPTGYGREVTARLVRELVGYGISIVSGLARGVDGVAHRTALERGGRTVGFLGGGIDSIYPAEHVSLANQMMQQGAVVSEFPPGFQPNRGNFPMRNRLISGVSMGVLVVEGLLKSGTKHTADHAHAQGRPVFIVPGPITSPMSNGPMDMLSDGAVMVRSGKDIVEYLQQNGYVGVDGHSNGKGEAKKWEFETELEELLYLMLQMEAMEGNELIRKSEMEASEVLTTLSMMELKGMVKMEGGEYRVKEEV